MGKTGSVEKKESAKLGGVETILFDFDGTLMDTTDIIIGSWQEVYRTVEGREEDEDIILATFGEILRDSLASKFPGHDVDELVSIYRDWQVDRFADEVKLFPGVKEMLEELSSAGYRMGLVTSRLKETSLLALRLFGIEDMFDCIITANDCTKHKPDPEPIELALRGMDADPETAIMVGDTKHDRGCAANADVRYVMVSWSRAMPGGAPEGGWPEGYEPDALIDEPADLCGIISRV